MVSLGFIFSVECEKSYFDQHLECAAPKRWSKYTTHLRKPIWETALFTQDKKKDLQKLWDPSKAYLVIIFSDMVKKVKKVFLERLIGISTILEIIGYTIAAFKNSKIYKFFLSLQNCMYAIPSIFAILSVGFLLIE